VRREVPPLVEDRVLSGDMERAAAMVRRGEFSRMVGGGREGA